MPASSTSPEVRWAILTDTRQWSPRLSRLLAFRRQCADTVRFNRNPLPRAPGWTWTSASPRPGSARRSKLRCPMRASDGRCTSTAGSATASPTPPPRAVTLRAWPTTASPPSAAIVVDGIQEGAIGGIDGITRTEQERVGLERGECCCRRHRATCARVRARCRLERLARQFYRRRRHATAPAARTTAAPAMSRNASRL